LASVSRNYFMGDKPFSEQDIVNKVIEHILKYRMGRHRLVIEVKVIDAREK
jgi:hypothetical protein